MELTAGQRTASEPQLDLTKAGAMMTSRKPRRSGAAVCITPSLLQLDPMRRRVRASPRVPAIVAKPPRMIQLVMPLLTP